MIRGIDNKGNVILGITRLELDGLAVGHRCCFPGDKPEAAGPHICLWFAETDEALLARLDEMYPDGVPAEPKDYRTKKETPE